ncbi:GNAT family N-acetyltransferase [Sphingomicrobium aestuariivivum]|uniref:GNAT family N-acetyltransferase n=1 Tax=Sphingomicrobium aestuariivivum TaxID=1582356 RepID=UPI001FD65898|nr:GNAT family protein [Sphingomicrobium aestuariivivum]MCJ8191968.1 GNAT family N-acetyltransferase [Sphingomicrobium aestuariivivum]
MNIQGKKVVLRAIEQDDLPALHRWANEPEIQSLLGGWHFPVSMQDQQRWFEALSVNSLNQRFAITTAENGLVGTANIVSIDWQNRNAFHGMLLGDADLRGTGVALDTVMTVMRYAFEELGLHRLDGDMIATNERSIDFYLRKCGWVEEGRKSGWYYRGGERHDKVVVGITADQYSAHVEEIGYWND